MIRFCLLMLLVSAPAMAGESSVAVAAKIVDSGRTADGRPAWEIVAQVNNVSAQPVVSVMMTCSWVSSWRLDSSKIFEVRSKNACESNYPREYILQPGDSIRFHFVVAAKFLREIVEGTRLRCGFIYISQVEEYERVEDDPAAKMPLVWANVLELPQVSSRTIRSIEVREEASSQ